MELNDSEEYSKRIPFLGRKLLRKLFNTVLGVPLIEPELKYEDGDTLETITAREREINKEFYTIPNWFLLTETLAFHVMLQCSRRPEIENNFALSPVG